MHAFLTWLAVSPLASVARVAAAAALVHIADNVADLGLPAVVQVALIAAIPVALRALNPEDIAYGLRDRELIDEDAA